ncbi:hypothetical protein IAU59_001177 [Kwoniella sp. CBS 9459]
MLNASAAAFYPASAKRLSPAAKPFFPIFLASPFPIHTRIPRVQSTVRASNTRGRVFDPVEFAQKYAEAASRARNAALAVSMIRNIVENAADKPEGVVFGAGSHSVDDQFAALEAEYRAAINHQGYIMPLPPMKDDVSGATATDSNGLKPSVDTSMTVAVQAGEKEGARSGKGFVRSFLHTTVMIFTALLALGWMMGGEDTDERKEYTA